MIQGFPGLGNSVGSSAGRVVLEQGWKRDPRVLLEKPLSHEGNLPQGTMIDASVNLLQTQFTECVREIHFHFS